MTIQSKVVPQFSNSRNEFVVHETIVPDFEGRLVIDLITRWGMVCGMPDGEDSSGRARLRLMTPQEVTDRAISTTQLVSQALKSKGWLAELPSIDELFSTTKDGDR